jgi:arginine/lysine/ornithine decarboxylase
MGELADFLNGYAESGAYRFHMPGHKGLINPWDITEIPGADALLNPTGALARLEGRLAALYGAEQSLISVGGSTAGVLAAVCAVCKDGDKIVAGRAAHRSFYGALVLSGALPVYVQPEETCFGFPGAVSPAAVKKALEENPGARAVFITSPTYEGVVSDIEAAAAAARARGAAVIVDEAHGAHFIHPAFPRSAVKLGADIVIQSLHKTLPALGQTAAVHASGRFAPEVRRFLSIIQTSSPSYPLMASAEAVLDKTADPRYMDGYAERLAGFRRGVSGLRNAALIGAGSFSGEEAFAFDISKVLFHVNSGETAARYFWRKGVMPEYAAKNRVLFMTAPADAPEAYAALAEAVRGLDRPPPAPLAKRAAREIPEMLIPPREAAGRPVRRVRYAGAAGLACGEIIAPFPPGAPLVCPGEAVPDWLENMDYIDIIDI